MKLVREIDGHKFYTNTYSTKEEARSNVQYDNTPIWDGMEGVWKNGSFNTWQEDTHVRP